MGPVPGGVATLERQLEVEFSRYEDEERQIDVIFGSRRQRAQRAVLHLTYDTSANNWPNLAFSRMSKGSAGVVICKLDQHRESFRGTSACSWLTNRIVS